MQLLATKQRKVEANQFKKHIVDGQKIIAVLTPCIRQMEEVKAKAGYETVEETMKVPLEKRLHELKHVVSHIMVQSLDPHPEPPQYSLTGAKEFAKHSILLIKAANFVTGK